MFYSMLDTIFDAPSKAKESYNNLPHKRKERAESNVRWEKNNLESEMDALEEQKEKSNELADELGKLKFECAESIIPEALDIIEKYQQINRKSTEINTDKLDQVNDIKLPYLKHHFSEYSSSVLKGVSAGTATATGAYAMVGIYGSASTGTALSALGGAAATNATVAWFGGGSLAAGGAGMAGGAVALGGIVALPVAVFAYMKYKESVEEEITALRVYAAELEVQAKKIEAMIEISISINKHISLYNSTLNKLIALLNEVLESFSEESNLKYKIGATIIIIKAIKDILKVSLFSLNGVDDDSQPSVESLSVMKICNNAVNYIKVSDFEVKNVINKSYSVAEVAGFNSFESGDMNEIEYLWLSELHDQFEIEKNTRIASQAKKRTSIIKKVAISLPCLALLILGYVVYVN